MRALSVRRGGQHLDWLKSAPRGAVGDAPTSFLRRAPAEVGANAATVALMSTSSHDAGRRAFAGRGSRLAGMQRCARSDGEFSFAKGNRPSDPRLAQRTSWSSARVCGGDEMTATPGQAIAR